ncbi:hypothetical protein HDV00_001947 [Rhizophlyctis rosea]|nr:hypothetical protein HDV00_001947 [Rhizophlyctis rosea]
MIPYHEEFPYHHAAAINDLPKLEYLYKVGSSTLKNMRDNKYRTPLYRAVYAKHLEATRFLLYALNCNPMVADSSGLLPLHVAAARGFLSGLVMLMDKMTFWLPGPDGVRNVKWERDSKTGRHPHDLPDEAGRGPLWHAVRGYANRGGDTACIQLLVSIEFGLFHAPGDFEHLVDIDRDRRRVLQFDVLSRSQFWPVWKEVMAIERKRVGKLKAESDRVLQREVERTRFEDGVDARTASEEKLETEDGHVEQLEKRNDKGKQRAKCETPAAEETTNPLAPDFDKLLLQLETERLQAGLGVYDDKQSSSSREDPRWQEWREKRDHENQRRWKEVERQECERHKRDGQYWKEMEQQRKEVEAVWEMADEVKRVEPLRLQRQRELEQIQQEKEERARREREEREERERQEKEARERAEEERVRREKKEREEHERREKEERERKQAEELDRIAQEEFERQERAKREQIEREEREQKEREEQERKEWGRMVQEEWERQEQERQDTEAPEQQDAMEHQSLELQEQQHKEERNRQEQADRDREWEEEQGRRRQEAQRRKEARERMEKEEHGRGERGGDGEGREMQEGEANIPAEGQAEIEEKDKKKKLGLGKALKKIFMP